MRYYSTNKKAPVTSLRDAIIKGLAPDKGLFMPEYIKPMSEEFFNSITGMSFQEMSYEVAKAFFGEDITMEELKRIVYDTLSFDCPVVHVNGKVWSLELFHGPTLAFKDVGARFMARMLRYFLHDKKVNVLVATSGDTGSAVANGFLCVEGIRVFVLYPKGKVSKIQECQFANLGKNITALEVDGNFDDCQAMVKEAFSDTGLTKQMSLTSANSINIARFLPQAFYYFYAYAQMKRQGNADHLTICVPSGNFGNLTAGLIAQRMGLPIKRFIAANNANNVFLKYLRSGKYTPCQSIQTIANAMDVGAPSNFARILDLFNNSHKDITELISGASYSDEQIKEAIAECYKKYNYILDPHGACGWLAINNNIKEDETGLFLETAHPAKFKNVVEEAINTEIKIPERLASFMNGHKMSIPMTNRFEDFKRFLTSHAYTR